MIYIYSIYIYICILPAPVVYRRGPSRAVHGLPTVQNYTQPLLQKPSCAVSSSPKTQTCSSMHNPGYMESRSCNRHPKNKAAML